MVVSQCASATYRGQCITQCPYLLFLYVINVKEPFLGVVHYYYQQATLLNRFYLVYFSIDGFDNYHPICFWVCRAHYIDHSCCFAFDKSQDFPLHNIKCRTDEYGGGICVDPARDE
jgi:hypothetical protein